MVRDQIAVRGIHDKRVLRALLRVERHRFVPLALRRLAYADRPLPIGEQQTISQPFIVAAMTAALRPAKSLRVLEIGTGSGYQTAVLAELFADVYTIEIIPALAQAAKARLRALGYSNIHVRTGDGYAGWPGLGGFDRILLTAAPPRIPEPLLRQLKVGGLLVAPVGPRGEQALVRITKTAQGIRREQLFGVRFVPMTGRAAERQSRPGPPQN